ncbi:hypothetical protein TNCV_4699671 [Trichonephila clavipes]|nr:hypothetical protein TNCV_4699671 [Trichonephila clavipes]
MIGSMIRKTNELDHHDADTVTQRLRSGVDRSGFVMWRSPGMMLPSQRVRHALLAKDLVTWQAMVGRHILEDIVGRVVQYVDEHYNC